MGWIAMKLDTNIWGPLNPKSDEFGFNIGHQQIKLGVKEGKKTAKGFQVLVL